MTEPTRQQLVERVDELESQLKRLLALWTAQMSTVRVEPGEALLIGGVDTSGDNVDAVLQAIADLRKATGIPHVWLFADDIDVQSVELKEQKHAMALEERIRKVREFAESMKTWCSPYGVSLGYANRLLAVLDGEDTPAAGGIVEPDER